MQRRDWSGRIGRGHIELLRHATGHGGDEPRQDPRYASFDEWGRLDAPEGARELTRALEILVDKLAPGARVLDLGGGPGRYAVELAKRGHRVVLADLSPELPVAC